MTHPPPSSPAPADHGRAASSVGPPARGGPTDPSHDDELRRGILHTQVTTPVAAFLVAAFLLMIFTVPLSQAVMERVKGDPSVLPELFGQWPTQDSIKQFEEDLENASYAREGVRPRLQALLTAWGGFGNTKAVIGRDGWLYYQPGITAVAGPGLLDPAILDSREKAARDAGGETVQADPRPAILEFHGYLARRGIKLILFPVPDKAGLQPAELHGRIDTTRALIPGRNPHQARLMAEFEAAGVLVFDPTPARLDPRRPPRFLKQDTHWTPDWMQEVAGALAAYLRRKGLTDGDPSEKTWSAVPRTVTRVGDIVDMLRLPVDQKLFAPQTVAVEEVRDAAGAPFEANATAPLLLLGDSFCNVFTLGQMGWGEAAGLAPQLARQLRRELDVIAQNDAGAFATRQLLWNEVNNPEPGGTDRLTGKRAVIWEFASRELAVGNWKTLRWPPPPVPPAGTKPPGEPR